VFERVLDVGIENSIVLEVSLSKGDVYVSYNRDGQVSIEVVSKSTISKTAADEFLKDNLRIEQKENQVTVHVASTLPSPDFLYRIGVPFRTKLISSVEVGNQKVLGIAGPADITSGVGDVDVNIVRFAGVKARTGKGKITCKRAIQVDAETQSGNITLIEDGASRAMVRTGLGRIEIGGARGTVEASTDGGEIHIKAVPVNDWQFTSVSGNIRIELPPKSQFDFDARTVSGQVSIEREGMQAPVDDPRHFQQKVDGGGKQIQAHTVGGNITIQ
jgi:DUF4097 and DUF4098 domain-containing protein YvlB